MSKQIREGYKMTELGEIPVEWEVQELSEILEICYGKSQKEVECNDGIYKILGTGGVIGYTNEFLWDKPSVLIGRKGTIDKPQYIEEPFWTVDTLFYTKIKNQNIAKWIYYYLNNIDLKRYNEATGVPSLSVSNLNKIRVSRPTVAEQKKIVEIISTVDNQIENTDGLIEKTKELKKGLMQRLLTKGIGHTEFKKTEIGKIPNEWEVKSLEEISIGKGEYGINAAAKEYEQNEPRYLRITDIDDNYKLSNQEIKSVDADEDEYQKYILKENDIVFARTGNTTGKSYLYEKCDGELVFAGFLIKFAINPLLYDSSFLKYYVQTKYYWDWVQKMSLRSGQPGINSKEYSSLLVPVPPVDEQYKIATILREVDNRIEKYDIKRQKLQHLKKGLMQKLLTGKLRAC